MSAVEASRDGILVVVEAFQGARVFGEREEGVGQFGRAAVERSGFDVPGAELAPFGDNHAIDEVALALACGLELFHVFVEELLEKFLRFVGEDDGLCGEAAADGVFG